MERRSSILRDACSKLQNASGMYAPYKNLHKSHVTVDNDKQIIQCLIPKIACTNFRRVFIGLSGMVNMSNVSQISGDNVYNIYYGRLELLSKNNESVQMQKLHSYKKFIFVREPFERLVSAYRNKFITHPNPNLRKMFYNQITSFYNNHPKLKTVRVFSRNVSQDTPAYTFQEFVQYVVDKFEIKSGIDPHFAPYWGICHPCDIHYDYIGKYEALYEDTDYIFSKLSIDAKFPGRNDNYTTGMTRDVVGEYSKQIPQALRKQLWEYLKTDYQMFDYPVPDEMKFDNK